jgi:preprotein translocase subunit SecD
MVIRLARFNLKLLLPVGLLLLLGCQMSQITQKKQPATLRVHIETNPYPPDQCEQIFVVRTAPIAINVEKKPFLNESHVTSAKVVETDEGFVLSVKFNDQGQWLLEQYTTANSRRRIAIRTQFRQTTNVFDRWLAAPRIARGITNGILTFTPDASQDEADLIVEGWNNVAGVKTAPKSKEKTVKLSLPE